MNKYLLTLILSLSSLQAETILPLETIIDPDLSKAEQYQQVINLLNFVREENQSAADQIDDLINQTDVALQDVNVNSFIDIIIQALVYIAARLKNYEENFVDYVHNGKKFKEIEAIST